MATTWRSSTVRVVDGDGLVCPNAAQLVRFHFDGPATIAGLDNGDPTNHEPFQGNRHKVFHGLGLVVVQAARSAGGMTLHTRPTVWSRPRIALTSVKEDKKAGN